MNWYRKDALLFKGTQFVGEESERDSYSVQVEMTTDETRGELFFLGTIIVLFEFWTVQHPVLDLPTAQAVLHA